MIDRNGSVHEDSLLGHSQANYLSKEIDVFLSPAGTSRDVVVPGKRVIYEFLLNECFASAIGVIIPIFSRAYLFTSTETDWQ